MGHSVKHICEEPQRGKKYGEAKEPGGKNPEENTLNPNIYAWLMGQKYPKRQKKMEAKKPIECILNCMKKHHALEVGKNTPRFQYELLYIPLETRARFFSGIV